MIWTIETNKGSFEETNLKEALNSIIEYYSDYSKPPLITNIFFTSDKIDKEFFNNVIKKAQDFINKGIDNNNKLIQQNIEYQEELKNDYYSNLI